MMEGLFQRRILQALGWLVVLVLVWRISAQGIGQHHAGQFSQQSIAADLTLLWLPSHGKALFARSEYPEIQPQEQKTMLQQAVDADPSNGLAIMAVARQYASATKQNNLQLADAAARLAVSLAPAHIPVRMQAAEYWLQRERWDIALEHWAQVLLASYDARAYLFPVLLALAENPGSHALLQPVIASNPSWWSAFFDHAVANALDLQTIRQLFAYRRQAAEPPSLEDRQRYFSHLKHVGRWSEAYIEWLNSLPNVQLKNSGLLFNGSFEYPIINTGFGWHTLTAQGVFLEAARTHGASGDNALHLVFRNEHERSYHVYQHVLLTPGRHRLQGRVRPDSLKGELGVQWQVRCLSNNSLLGASDRFLGVDLWHDFAFDYQVPGEGCSVQEVRLVALEKVNGTPASLEGEIWFDDLSISRLW